MAVMMSMTQAVTIGLHGVQSQEDIADLTRRESLQEGGYKVQIIGLIFDEYTKKESDYLTQVVNTLGTGRIYHISISPYGYTAKQVAE